MDDSQVTKTGKSGVERARVNLIPVVNLDGVTMFYVRLSALPYIGNTLLSFDVVSKSDSKIVVKSNERTTYISTS